MVSHAQPEAYQSWAWYCRSKETWQAVGMYTRQAKHGFRSLQKERNVN